MVSLHGKKSIIRFVPLEKIPKIKIFHMVASEHPEVIEGRRRLIVTDVLDSEEVAEDGSIDNDGDASYEEDYSGLGEVVLRTGVTQSGAKEVKEVQWVVKSSSPSSYMLKPCSSLRKEKHSKTQRGKSKRNPQEEFLGISNPKEDPSWR